MSTTAVLTVSPAIKSEWTALQAQRKADRAAERARIAAEDAEKARERAREAVLAKAAATKEKAVTERMSAKNFGSKDPERTLRILECVDLDSDPLRLELANVSPKLIIQKYCLRSLTARLASETPDTDSLCASTKAANMPAATALRFLFVVARELADADPERYKEARGQLQWHDSQQMLKNNKNTRGVGIVAYTDAAMELLKAGLTAARDKIQRKVDCKAAYDAEMFGDAESV